MSLGGGSSKSQSSNDTRLLYKQDIPQQPTISDTMDDLNKAMPAIMTLLAQYTPQLMKASQDAYASINPETAKIQENLARDINAGMDAAVPDWMRQSYLNDTAGILGNQFNSRIGADTASTGLQKLRMDYNNYFRDLGLNLVNTKTPNNTAMSEIFTQGLSPSTLLGNTAQNYSTYMQGWNPTPGAYGNSKSSDWKGSASLAG